MLEGYITPLLMSYINKYVNNIKPSDLKVSFWGGDAVLRNLELRLDVLKKELHVPLEFTSGFVRELVIHLPWSSIASTSVEVTIKDLELVIQLKSLNKAASSEGSSEDEEKGAIGDEQSSSDLSSVGELPQSESGKKEEALPGYLQGYMNRVLNNVHVHVQNMVVKVLEEESDLMLTLNIGSIEFFTANKNWEREFIYTDYFQGGYSLNKVCEVRDVGINLHPIDIGEKAQGSFLHEPFVRRSSFTCRVRFECSKKILIRKSFEVLIENSEFSVDEKQFCLFLHLLDRLLAMYYNSKRLKGRDDIECTSVVKSRKTEGRLDYMLTEKDGSDVNLNREFSSAPYAANADQSDLGSPPMPSKSGNEAISLQDSALGWGSWLMSVVGGAEEEKREEEKGGKEEEPDSESFSEGHGLGGVEIKQKASELANFHFSITAKSVTVTLKMTQQVQVPVFLSLRSFTTPVVVVRFAGCMATIDRCPMSRSFVVSVGIMSVAGEVLGYCPCVKKYPSSWRRASAAASSDSSKVVKVFSMGPDIADSRMETKTDDTKVESSELEDDREDADKDLLKYSLFARQNTAEYPLDIDKAFLDDLGRPFKAVWFTYDYHDVSPTASVEECTETLQVGVVNAAVSPDVVHRLELYLLSFKNSLEATPLVSTGMVVLGDPKAVTFFNVSLDGIYVSLTSATHYLPVITTPTHKSKTPPMPLKQSKKSKKQSAPLLPGLFFNLGESKVDTMLPMYRGNATLDVPQKLQLHGRLCDIRSEVLNVLSLADGISVPTRGGRSLDDQILDVPLVDCTHHVAKYGEVADSCRDTQYSKILVSHSSLKLTIQQISKVVFVCGSWKKTELDNFLSGGVPSFTPALKYQPPLLSWKKTRRLSCAVLTLSDVEVGMSQNVKVVSYTAAIGSAHVCAARDGSRGGFIPLLHGPLDTSRFAKVETFQYQEKLSAVSSDDRMDCPGKKLVEALLTSPQGDHKETVFSTMQCRISGICLNLEPAILEFLKLLTVHSIEASSTLKSGEGTAASPLTGGTVGPQAEGFGLPFTFTPSRFASDVDADDDGDDTSDQQLAEHNGVISSLKTFAVKVNLDPVVFIFPISNSPLADSTEDSSSGFHKFPILLQIFTLNRSALIVSSPQVVLESAKSHVLDEPVPRLGRSDTLPWDCSLTDACVFTTSLDCLRYLLEPLTVKASLAAQQEGLGVTIHSETVALALSKKQVAMVKTIVADLSAKVSAIKSSLKASSQTPKVQPGGVASRSGSEGCIHTMAPPTTPSATPSSFRTLSDISTVSSSYQGVSSLWLQLLVSKCLLHLYGKESASKPPPIEEEGMNASSHTTGSGPVRVSLEADSMSLQVDVQEKCTDFILKLASLESHLTVLGITSKAWEPYHPHSRGKLFSSTISNLPDDILQVTAPGFSLNQFQTPGMGRTKDVYSTCFSPNLSSSFLYLKGYVPLKFPRIPKFEMNIRPFELVVWLPVAGLVNSIFGSELAPSSLSHPPPPPPPPASEASSTTTWPSLQLTVDCFRVVFPSRNLLHASLLLTSAGLRVSSAVDFAGPEVRHVINQRGYRKLVLLTAERKRPPLPAYQCDLYSVAVWGVGGESLKRAFLYLSNTDLQLTYTPPLYSVPQGKHMQEPPGINKLSSMVCGHCLEVLLTNDCCIFSGKEQISTIVDILKTNNLHSKAWHSTSAVHVQSISSSHSDPQNRCDSEYQSVSSAQPAPFKLLVTGKIVTAALYSSRGRTTAEDRAGCQGCDVGLPAEALLQAAFYNPVFTLQSSEERDAERGEWRRKTSGEISVFDLAMTCNKDASTLVYTELMDSTNLPSVSAPVFSTKAGLAKEGTNLPPNLLDITFSFSPSSNGLKYPETTTSLELKVERSCKLVCSTGQLRDVVGIAVEMFDELKKFRKKKETSDADAPSTKNVFPQFPLPDIQLSTGQFLFEFLSNTEEDSNVSKLEQASPCPEEDEEGPVLSTKEAILLSWDSLTVSSQSTLERGSSGNAGGMPKLDGSARLSGLQLLSYFSGCSEFIVPPVMLQASLVQHQPDSGLDQSYLLVSLSIGLVDILLSQSSVVTLLKTVQILTACIKKGLSEGNHVNSVAREEEENDGTSESAKNFSDIQHFSDDLRDFPFKRIVEDSESLELPSAGEVVLYNGGSSSQPPAMYWHYWEPRAITKLHVSPIPLVTSDEDLTFATDIKVNCSLEYWDDFTSTFISVGHFTVCKSTSASIEDFSDRPSSRLWRVTLTHLISWDNEEIGHDPSHIGYFTNDDGKLLLLSTILPPPCLADNTTVESSFSPSFLLSLSIDLCCDRLRLNIFHRRSTTEKSTYEGFYIDENAMSRTYSRTLELVQFTASELKLKMTTMKEDLHVVLNWLSELKYVDFYDLLWNTALHPVVISLSLHWHHGQNSLEMCQNAEFESGSSLSVDVKVGPAVLKVSQGLHYTLSLALHAWKQVFTLWKSAFEPQKLEEESSMVMEKSRVVEDKNVTATLLPGYFIICNDTNQDLLIGQDMTAEKVLLCKSCCMSYSWYNHTSAPHKLRIAQGVENVECPNWTSSFFLFESPSFHVLQIPLKLSSLVGMGSLYVAIVGKGGMQKQVVLSGNWKFSSALHIPIDLRVGVTNEDGSYMQYGDVRTLHPGGQLPSILAPDGAVEGINLRITTTVHWSVTYPLPAGGVGWNKPNMLMEIPDEKGGKLQFWFNAKPMIMSAKLCGHKITFSHLFAVKNCLPLELGLFIDHANLKGSMDSKLRISSTCLGNGHTLPLLSLQADKWYWLKFGVECSTLALSEPPISLSTFLLHHLPFASSERAPLSRSSGTPPSFSVISLHLDGCKTRSCKMHVILMRNELNTITVVLKPEWILLNQTGLPLFVMEPTLDIVEVEKQSIECPPSSSQILCQDEFVLKTDYNDVPLISNLVKCPPVKFVENYNEEETRTSVEEQLAIIPLYMNPVLLLEPDDHRNSNIISEAAVSFKKQGSIFVARVCPAFILHNNTAYSINVKPFIMKLGQSCDHTPSNARIVQKLNPGSTVPILYWNVCSNFTPTVNTALTHTLSFFAGCSDDVKASDSFLWSIHLSTDFVRHSFSLPILEASQYSMAPCLLTMHEKSDITYLVIQYDINPPVVLHNLSCIDFQVVEAQATGVNACPQCLPAQQQVAYQPPSIAKLYPMVYDEEVATEKDKRMIQSAHNVRMKVQKSSQFENTSSWSEPFSLAEGNKIFNVPEYGEILLSIEHKDQSFNLTIHSTSGTTSDCSHQAINRAGIKFHSMGLSRSIKISVNLSYFMCSLLDDTSKLKRRTEILRAIVNDFLCIYSVKNGNSKVDLTAYSLRIENMTRYHTGEFDVCFIPRSEHAAPSQLFHQDFPPVIKVVVHYNTEPKLTVRSFYFRLEPLTIQLEDSLLKELKRILESFKLSELFKLTDEHNDEVRIDYISACILQESERDIHPISITNFMVEPIAIYLSARITLKAFLSCNDTPLRFSRYELEGINSNWSEISRVVAARYVSALFMHVGWVIGSLELIGSPVSFLQSVSKGLRDLVVLPYEGMTRSPGMFVLGIGHGTASFFRQVSSGALTSVTSLTQSISRNMERLSMDQDHISYQEQMRQQRPATHFSSAIATGFSSFGLSLMSAVAGLVEQPMQSVQCMEETDGTATALLKGVGKGLLGVVTKPVGGAMELISKTGQGILSGTGLGQKLQRCKIPENLAEFVADPAVLQVFLTSSSYLRNFGETNAFLLHWSVNKAGTSNGLVLFLTTTNLLIFKTHSNTVFTKIDIKHCELEVPPIGVESQQKAQVELHIVDTKHIHDQMDWIERKLEDIEIGEKYFHSVKPEDICQPETILLVDDCTDSIEEIKEKSKQEQQQQNATEPCKEIFDREQNLAKRKSDEVFLMEECDARQFLAIYYELKQSYTNSDHLYLI